MNVHGRLAAHAAVLLALACACGGPRRRPEDYGASPERIEALPETARDDFQRVRRALDSGDTGVARAILDALVAARPEDIGGAVMLQELRLELATPQERETIVQAARATAENAPTVVNLLLAARVDSDSASARATLARAVLVDPNNAWAHYALAHNAARSGDWAAAQKAIDRALELDPGHRAARRLEAAILARAGQLDEARQALEVWLAVTDDDPRVDTRLRASAQLDLAHLYLLAGKESKARELLLALGSAPSDEIRRLCLLAAVDQALERPADALEDARSAQRADPHALMPLVQEALLLQHDFHDSDAAVVAWRKVLAATKGNPGLSALVQSLRARVVLERAEAPAP